ncbi:MAG: hypothetical protein GY844_18090 [Bradyrhizobium sp.]|nr:hypothetical protein [Bradyrhizobium sp.]
MEDISIVKQSAAVGSIERRNRAVHDPWITVEGKIYRVEATARIALPSQLTEETMRLVADISKLTDLYAEIMKAHLPDWHTSPEARRGA